MTKSERREGQTGAEGKEGLAKLGRRADAIRH